MKKNIKLNEETLKYALMGGTILGGGGGGSMDMGEAAGKIALEYGDIELVDINMLNNDDLIVTVSAVGAPAARDKFVKPKDYVQSLKNLEEHLDEKIDGIITNENGGAATINGWIQASILDIPLIDAACNGRGHPTGMMGSMSLNNIKDYISDQSFSGGNPKLGNKLEGLISGDIFKVSRMVRQASVEAGGMLAVARNPVRLRYIKKNAAVGAISHAINLGKRYYEGIEISPYAAIKNVTDFLEGEIVVEGRITKFELTTDGGFDLGQVKIAGLDLTFWNEYMTLENGDKKRLYTFPDFIMSFDKETGAPLTTAEIKEGDKIVIIASKKENIKLGSTMFDDILLREIESIINKEIVKYI